MTGNVSDLGATVSPCQQVTKPDLTAFRARFPTKPINPLAVRYKNDCELLGREQGLLDLEYPANADAHVTAVNERGELDFEVGKYLWAVTAADGLHALETKGAVLQVGGGCLKHSNLTGGQSANGGGEMWYWKNKNTVIVNAHSGRYGDRTPGGVEMAQALVSALRECGFKAAITGIEQDTDALRAYPDPEAQLDF